jgi:hypothetical protein
MRIVLENSGWLLFGTGAVIWLLLLTSSVMSALRREGKMRAQLDELAEEVKHLTVAEQRRFYEQIKQPIDIPPLAIEAEENEKQPPRAAPVSAKAITAE